ncbi:protein of unknown function [Pararobbsia alpina]
MAGRLPVARLAAARAVCDGAVLQSLVDSRDGEGRHLAAHHHHHRAESAGHARRRYRDRDGPVHHGAADRDRRRDRHDRAGRVRHGGGRRRHGRPADGPRFRTALHRQHGRLDRRAFAVHEPDRRARVPDHRRASAGARRADRQLLSRADHRHADLGRGLAHDGRMGCDHLLRRAAPLVARGHRAADREPCARGTQSRCAADRCLSSRLAAHAHRRLADAAMDDAEPHAVLLAALLDGHGRAHTGHRWAGLTDVPTEYRVTRGKKKRPRNPWPLHFAPKAGFSGR